MKIFYDGEVIVLDDISDEKAKDIMVFSTNNYAAFIWMKASLHRFLEKRKNRAPYQTTYPATTINKTIDKSMAWLSLTP
ncbi:protein TIFY 11d-like [Trifolium pratense]|uniref:protein TIFY 11d-like n=1 Tax=Trifolium pratense TaxID=57577 RepID=UPI001E695DBF|nr:protein TIFY 11d-like [Trifolium pratense]